MNRVPNEDWFDGWSWAHFGSGLLLGALGMQYDTFLVGHLIYDGAEQVVERTEWGQQLFDTKGPEHPRNIIGDTAVASLGWYISTKLVHG